MNEWNRITYKQAEKKVLNYKLSIAKVEPLSWYMQNMLGDWCYMFALRRSNDKKAVSAT